jgi:regulator of protease activity HflC (stomatin/prohibitin superfamily)
MNKYFSMVLAVLAMMIVTGCGQLVPPGKVVIVLDPQGGSTIFTKGVYKTYGRDKAYFVDGKMKSFTEQMKILCKDDINMDVDVKAVLSFKVSEDSIEFIKTKVPTERVDTGDVTGYELSLEKFYDMTVKDIVRSSARNIVSQYITDDIRPNRETIEADLNENIRKRIAELKYPLDVSAILVSNIDYPDSVKEMRNKIKQVQLSEQEKAAIAQAALAEAKRNVAVEQERAKVKLVKAEAEAAENLILAKALTPQFLQWRQFEVMETIASELSKGTNNTVYMMPYETMTPAKMDAALIRDAVSTKSAE